MSRESKQTPSHTSVGQSLKLYAALLMDRVRINRLFYRLYRLSYTRNFLQTKRTPNYAVLESAHDISGFSDFIFKDETWNNVRHIDTIFIVKSFGLNYKVRDNTCDNTKITIKNSTALVRGKGGLNDWVYWYLDDILPTSYKIDFKVTIRSDLTEFQIAFGHSSITERFRFQVVENNFLSFDVVRHGFFFNKLATKPFSFELGREYNVSLVVLDNTYCFSVDGLPIMVIENRSDIRPKGGMVIVLWDESKRSPLNVDIRNFTITPIEAATGNLAKT